MSDNDPRDPSFPAPSSQDPSSRASSSPAPSSQPLPPVGPPLDQTPPGTVPAAQPVSAFRRRRGLLIGGAAVLALGIGAGGVAVGTALAALRTDTSTTQAQGGTGGTYGQGDTGGQGGQQGTFTGPGTASVNASAATDAQKVGVVTIVTELEYDSSSSAAGTGIILTSDGEILTNNHVVEGSSAIKVTVESTGKTYTAEVVGTDETDDIAVLQLVDSSGSDVTGLTRATIDTDTLSSGAAVTSIGNAEGTGNLVAASGTVTATDQSITVANDITGADEKLGGLIETDADVVSGDSGGPLIDAQGEVTGVVTAASSGSRNVTGYAIPINTAVSIAKKIVNGEASSTIVIGLPAFLGVELAQTQDQTPGQAQGQTPAQTGSGALLSGVVAGSGAAATGLAAGDTITAVDGTAVTTADSLSALIKAHKVGDQVAVTYTDASGASQQATVTLGAGPAA